MRPRIGGRPNGALDVKLSEYDLIDYPVRRVPSPGQCIYCGGKGIPLTDEHVIPYALAANTLILEKSCCIPCQRIIQRYEQEVLKKQLGDFRAQVDAPTRSRKERALDVALQFAEVNIAGQPIRDLGVRRIPMSDAPLALNLWTSPPPSLLRGEDEQPIDETGRPWTYVEVERAVALSRIVAAETGAEHVSVKIGEVNRLHYLRSLAKTAHAYAAAEIGVDAFEPMLRDVILCRSNDVAQYVGGDFGSSPIDLHIAQTVQISIAEVAEGPSRGLLVVRIQLYPSLGSPAHLVVLGRALKDIGSIISG